MHASSSVPVLPAPGRPVSRMSESRGMRGGGSSRSHAQLASGETIELLAEENRQLRHEIDREKRHFQTMFVKDSKSAARRRLEPMRKLLNEQQDATSEVATQARVKQQLSSGVLTRVKYETAVLEKRQQDVAEMEGQLQTVEMRVANADADVSDASERELTYRMMSERLQKLAIEDQVRGGRCASPALVPPSRSRRSRVARRRALSCGAASERARP
jgi:hypothetical protein